MITQLQYPDRRDVNESSNWGVLHSVTTPLKARFVLNLLSYRSTTSSADQLHTSIQKYMKIKHTASQLFCKKTVQLPLHSGTLLLLQDKADNSLYAQACAQRTRC